MLSAEAMTAPRTLGIVMHDFPLGGTERIALRLAKSWAALGVKVTIFVGDARGTLRDMVPEAIGLIEADPPIPRGKGSRERLGAAAAGYFGEHPVDGLFVTGNFHWELVPALAALPTKLVVQISSPLVMPQRGRLLQWRFRRRMRRLLRNADALVAMDETNQVRADSMIGRAMTTAIPLPALDDDALVPTPASGRTILAAGRLIRQKGFDILIDAAARLDDPTIRLVIVGSGPEEQALRQRIDRHGLADRVTLTGFVPDIRPWLAEARLFVLPSRFEGYGAVILEALDAGRPVIATRSTPAVDDVLDDPECGLSVPIEDVDALAAAIQSVLDTPAPDPARLSASVDRFRIGAGARAYLDLFA
jgi:glycosyltransferase involved in cell wall biosynthesis